MIKFNFSQLAVGLVILAIFLYFELFVVITAFALFGLFIEVVVTLIVIDRCKRIKLRENITKRDTEFVHQMMDIFIHQNAELYSIFKSVLRSVVGVGLISYYGLNVAGSCYLIMVVLSRIRYQKCQNLFIKN